jgi:hypothetical protein
MDCGTRVLVSVEKISPFNKITRIPSPSVGDGGLSDGLKEGNWEPLISLVLGKSLHIPLTHVR